MTTSGHTGLMLLDPADPLTEVLTLQAAADRAGVSARTVRRWVQLGHLKPIPRSDGKLFTERAVLECERDRHVAAHQGRPGARVRLDMLT